MKLLAKSLLLATSLTAGLLYAQPRGGSSGNDKRDAEAAQAQLSPREMLEKLESLDKQVAQDFKHVMFLQAQARKAKDVIRLNCVNGELLEIKAILNAFERDGQSLVSLVADESEQRHEVFGSVVKHGEGVRQHREAAEACAGEPEISAESDNNYTSPDFDLDPTEDDDSSEDPDVEPPGYASPFN